MVPSVVLLPIITKGRILSKIGCVSECSWWFVYALCTGHCLLPSLCCCTHPGRREAIQKEIGNPTSEKNYKRATLRNAVGEYTCIQEHNEWVTLFGRLNWFVWKQGICSNRLYAFCNKWEMQILFICLTFFLNLGSDRSFVIFLWFESNP